jgi:hypothetical protein
MKVAIKIHKDKLSSYGQDPSREEIESLLPLHVQSCGLIVEIEEIFDVSIIEPPIRCCRTCLFAMDTEENIACSLLLRGDDYHPEVKQGMLNQGKECPGWAEKKDG